MKRNWFYRMLFSYMPVFLAVCCTLLFIMFLTVRQLSEQSSIQSNETVANNAVQMLEQTLVGIEESMAGLINSETIIGYYSRPDDTLYTSSYQAALALTSLQKRFPIIHDLYLVNPEDSSVLEATKITELIRHPDQAYIEAKLKSKTRYLWGDRRAPSASSSLGEAEVISLARIADLRTRGLLVVRIDVKAMQQLLNRSVNPATGYIQVLDRSGSLVVSTQSTEEGGKESRKLAQVNMAYTGWTIESGVLQPGILSWAEPVLYISISLGGFCILVGLAWIVMTTRRHYRPVQSLISQISMVDTLRKPASSVHEGSKDEFQTIGNAIDNLWNHSNQLRQENEANLKLKREHQFRRMAEGRFESASYYGALEEELFGLQLQDGRPTALLVEMDRFLTDISELYPEHEKQLFKDTLQTVFDKSLSQAHFSFASDWLSDHQFGAIVMQKEGMEDRLLELMEQFRRWTERELPFTVTIAVGVAVERIEAVSVSFQTTRKALSYKVSLGLNRIIDQSALPDSEQNNTVTELQRIEEMSRSLRMGERAWEGELNQFIATLQTGSFSGEQVRNLLFVLLFHIQHKMSDLPDELENVWLSANTSLEKAMSRGETLDDIGNSLGKTLAVVSDRIREWKDSKNNRTVVQDIKRYIDEHYSDPNMSQSMLAETFKLHSSSISRLFKEEYGVKFVDYVNSVRVEHAARLMGQGNSTVQEVAEKVGFVHSTTFISIFKKVTGFTPGTYQKNHPGTEA